MFLPNPDFSSELTDQAILLTHREPHRGWHELNSTVAVSDYWRKVFHTNYKLIPVDRRSPPIKHGLGRRWSNPSGMVNFEVSVL